MARPEKPVSDRLTGQVQSISTDRLHAMVDGLLDLRPHVVDRAECDRELTVIAVELRRRS